MALFANRLLNVLNSSFFVRLSRLPPLLQEPLQRASHRSVSLGLENSVIPLPPPAEQQRIVAEVERRLSVVEELEAVVNANLQRAIRLRQSILQRAFEGTLLRTEKEEPSVNDESLPLAAEPPGHYEQHR